MRVDSSFKGLAQAVARRADVTAGADVKTRPRFDVSKLPFRVVIEVKANTSAMTTALKGLQGWNAVACDYDCSHGYYNDGGYSRFTHIQSPTLSLGSGALEQITDALNRVRQHGAETGRTGAMHMYVPTNVLDDKATKSLFRLHCANEDLLYALGQHGGQGRELNHKLQYACSLNGRVNRCKSVADHQRAVSSHSYSLNASKRGEWEFRYLDSSLDGKAVGASVQLICGMVGAAVDGRNSSAWKGSNRANALGKVDRKRWDALMEATVPPDVAERLEQHVRNAGASLPSRPGANVMRLVLENLLSNQWQVEASGHVSGSLPEVEASLAASARDGGHDTFNLVDPNGNRVTVAAASLSTLALAAAMERKGVEFHHVAASTAPSTRVAVQGDFPQTLQTRGVKVKMPHLTFWNWIPRRHVTITNAADLGHLAKKL